MHSEHTRLSDFYDRYCYLYEQQEEKEKQWKQQRIITFQVIGICLTSCKNFNLFQQHRIHKFNSFSHMISSFVQHIQQ
jgi:hypothetical protein